MTVVDDVHSATPRSTADEYRTMRQVFGTFGADHHHRHRTVGLQTAVELAERIDYPSASQVVVHCHGRAHHRAVVVERIPTAPHSDTAQIFRRRPVGP